MADPASTLSAAGRPGLSAPAEAAGGLRWEAAGQGRPLVLLHGFSFDRRAWDGQMAAFSHGHHVVRYDLRGFGQSDVPTGAYSHVDDLRRLISDLGLERPVLVGLSLGAVTALNYAVRHGSEVAGLVLASPGLPGWRWTQERPPEAAAAHARAHGTEAARRFWLNDALFATARQRPGATEAIAAMVGDYSGWHWKNGDAPRWDEKLLERLDRIPVPALIVSGQRDVAGYRDIAAALADALPLARMVRIDAGHMVNIEAPEAFNAAVIEFLDGLGPSASLGGGKAEHHA